MIVLRAIGAFFAKIWRWIKQTAWVQPLLIVGLIFGVMFSIKPIYNAIKNASAKAASTDVYYRQFQKSLKGGENSVAYKLTNKIYESMQDSTKKWNGSEFGLGDKFFLMYVAEDCDKCASAKGGFEYLQDNFSGIYKPEAKFGQTFGLATIYTDEVMTDGSDKDKTAFIQYLEHFEKFFEVVGGGIYDSPFHINGGISDDDIAAIEQADPDTFLTPTIFLVDFTKDNTDPQPGINDVFVGVEESGTSSNADANKAQFLYEAWTKDGKFKRS